MMNRFGTVPHVVHAAGRTAAFFLEVLPTLPSRPVDWMTPAPVVEHVRYPTPAGLVEGELYRPVTAGPHPGAVVCLGVVPFGVDHPQVPRLGAALARSGLAALLYWSPAMRDLRLDPEDVDGIAMAYHWLIEQPLIDADRSGLIGTCVGGSFALMAAARPDIRDRIAFIVAWAPYSSMWTFARDISSASTSADGAGRAPWQVDQLTRKVYVRSLTALLPPKEAEHLRSACAERDGDLDGETVSKDGRAIYSLLIALDAAAAETALRRLPPVMRDRLNAMSPLLYLEDVHAPLVLLAHDRDDPVIPIAESRQLRDAFGGRPGVRYTEFTMFKHLDPARVHLPVFALLRELGKFYLALYPVFRRTETG